MEGKVINFKRVLNRVQITCIVCGGVITLLSLVGLWFKPTFMPIFAFLLLLPIVVMGNGNNSRGDVNCSLINHYTFFAILLSGIVMLAINLINTSWITIKTFGSDEVKYISTLVVYPIAAMFYGIAMLRRGKPEYCIACKEKSCNSVKKSIERNLFHRESRSLLISLFVLSLLISIVAWTYYFVFYINVNINSPDIFFFYITPVAAYGLYVFYMLSRYANIQFKFTIAPGRAEHLHVTHLRYWVLKGDKMMLQMIGIDGAGAELYDTPAVGEMPYTEKVSHEQARQAFSNLSGTNDFTLKYLFVTSDETSNIMHYVAVLNSKDVKTPALQGEYYNLYEVNEMLKAGQLVKPLGYELHRVFEITMAWKTYDREGNRLYPIKKYRPTFRLADILDWNVDYDDLSWMGISKNNADKPFFKLKKFWRQHVSGVNLRWKSRQ